MIYAGIGSRQTPGYILAKMSDIGYHFASKGFTLRSGGAKGADSAFEHGCYSYARFNKEHCRKEIYTINDNIPGWCYEMAKKFHPAWDKCSSYAKILHARNSLILFGDNGSKVDFIVCWTKDGKITGGTGQALRIAQYYEIPVWNLFHKDTYSKLWQWFVKENYKNG